MDHRCMKPVEKSIDAETKHTLPLRAAQCQRGFSHSRLQSGQAIVLMALMMVALMAILGLAIDGGGLFFLHRDTQNATDAAVIAATYARCTSDDPTVVEFAGRQAAARNGFNNTGASDWVVVNNPPDTGAGAGEAEYVEVMITATKPSYFIQLVFPEPLRVTSRAVGRCSPPFDPATLPALFGISRDCPVDLTGSRITVDSDPAMHTNDTVHASGSSTVIDGRTTSVDPIAPDPSGNTTYTDGPYTGEEYYRDDPLGENFAIEQFRSGRFWQQATIKTIIDLDHPDSDFRNGTWSPNGRTLEGLYYVDGDVAINNVSIGPSGITIAATGAIDFRGGANVFYHVGGMLLVSDRVTTCTGDAVHISGSSVQWYGVIYAPNGGASISGSNHNIIGAVIAQGINFSASNTTITYDPDILDPIPANVTVSE